MHIKLKCEVMTFSYNWRDNNWWNANQIDMWSDDIFLLWRDGRINENQIEMQSDEYFYCKERIH